MLEHIKMQVETPRMPEWFYARSNHAHAHKLYRLVLTRGRSHSCQNG